MPHHRTKAEKLRAEQRRKVVRVSATGYHFESSNDGEDVLVNTEHEQFFAFPIKHIYGDIAKTVLVSVVMGTLVIGAFFMGFGK